MLHRTNLILKKVLKINCILFKYKFIFNAPLATTITTNNTIFLFTFMKNIQRTFWTVASNKIRILTSAKDLKTSRALLNKNNMVHNTYFCMYLNLYNKSVTLLYLLVYIIIISIQSLVRSGLSFSPFRWPFLADRWL